MKTNDSDAQIENLIRKHYPEIADLAPLSGGLVSQTFSFQSGDNRYLFQIGGSQEDYEKQHYISKQFGMTIPVRQVVSVHKTEDGVAYCFSTFIEGQKLFDLNARERREVAGPVIDILLRMAEIEIPIGSGYGRFDANGNAPYKTWHDFISADIVSVYYNFWDELEDIVCLYADVLTPGSLTTAPRSFRERVLSELMYICEA